MKRIDKYDVVLADFNPRKGHAQSGKRPAVVIQSNLFNNRAPTVMVVPLTTQQKKLFPSEFLIEPSKKNGLNKASRFLGSQVMTVDKDFVSKRLGKLEDRYYPEVREAMRVSLDWEDDFV